MNLLPQRWRHIILDACAVYLQPFLAFVTLLVGGLMNVEYAGLRETHPRWAGPLSALEVAMSAKVFAIAAVLSLLTGVVVAKRQGTIKGLSNANQTKQVQLDEIGTIIVIVFDGLLLNLADKLELAQGSQARLTLYIHDAARDAFIPCGRYAQNPNFRAPGRTFYPSSEGCIGEGWAKGWHFDNQVPTTAGARRSYNRKTYAMPEWTTDSLRMNSALYAVKRLHNVAGAAEAVLVVEALEANAFEENALRAKLEEVSVDYARVIHELRDYIPNPAKAAESGL